MKTLFRLAAFAALCLTAMAQTVTVRGTLYQANAQPWNGWIEFRWPTFTTASGIVVAASKLPQVITVRDGQIKVALFPTEGSDPSGVAYTVTYHSASQTYDEPWTIPSGVTQTTLRDVRKGSTLIIFPSQIDGTGAQVGWTLCFDGTRYKPGTCGGGGGGGGTWGTILGTITAQPDLMNLFAGKANVVHPHAIADITLLQATLDLKAPLTHIHAINDVTNLQTTLNGKSNTGHHHTESEVDNLETDMAAKADRAHTHIEGDVTNLQSDLAARELLANKGVPGGYVPLGLDGKILGDYLPPGNGMTALSSDSTPRLGGDLDMNGYKLQGVSPLEMARVAGVTSNIQSQLDNRSLVGHTHPYEPLDATILRQANLSGTGSAVTPARSDHNHNATYVALGGSYSNPAWITGLDWSKLLNVPSFEPVDATILRTSGTRTANSLLVFDPTGKAVAINCTYNTSTQVLTCGDGTLRSFVSLPELASSGHGTDFRIYGGASQAVNGCITVSGNPSALNQGLLSTGSTETIDGRTCTVMQWANSSQVNSDWNAVSGAAQILNKPTFATVATTGSYTDLTNRPSLATVATTGSYNDLSNKPTIPAAQVNSDWNAVSGLPQILNKPTLGGAAALNVGTGAGTVAAGNDSRFTDARTPVTHSHDGTAGSGGQLAEGALNLSDVTTGNASITKHGFMPKLSGDGSAPFCGDGTFSTNCKGSGSGGTGIGKSSLSATWTAIADGGCQEQTATWTGVTTADTIILGLPASFASGLAANARVSGADTVAIRICNLSGASVTPGAQTFAGMLAAYALSNSATIDFPSIPDGTCNAQTFAMAGVAAGDPLTPKWPASLEAGLYGNMRASANNTVEVRLCNLSGAALNPASQTFGASTGAGGSAAGLLPDAVNSGISVQNGTEPKFRMIPSSANFSGTIDDALVWTYNVNWTDAGGWASRDVGGKPAGRLGFENNYNNGGTPMGEFNWDVAASGTGNVSWNRVFNFQRSTDGTSKGRADILVPLVVTPTGIDLSGTNGYAMYVSGGPTYMDGTLNLHAVGAYSALPTCNAGAEGSMKPVNDSNTAVWGATVAAGGSNHILAYCDGTSWTVMAK